MAEAFIGEIRMFGGNYAPRNWAFCNGQLLPIAGHDALFSIIGNIYGGDGRTTLGLPDLRGRVPMHFGTGPGLTNVNQGSKSGVQNVMLSASNIPPLTSTGNVTPTGTVTADVTVNASNATGTSHNPKGKVWAPDADLDTTDKLYNTYDASSTVQMATEAVVVKPDLTLNSVPVSVRSSNSKQAAVNTQTPYQAVAFIIALEGLYPSR